MRRLYPLCLLLCLLCSCHAPFSLPRAAEPRSIAIASVLGVDQKLGQINAFAATQQRGDEAPDVFRGAGDSLAAARLASRDEKTSTVSYAHVEHIVISPTVAQDYLSQLLSYSFQNGEQSMESKLWILQEGEMEALFDGQVDVARRLTALEIGGDAGTTLAGRSLRQIATRLLDGGDVLLPALRLKEGTLVFDGYVLVREGVPVGAVWGDVARDVNVLAGEEIYWTQPVRTQEGATGVVQLHSGSVQVKPQIAQGELCRLEVICRIDGQIMELWSAEDVEWLHDQVTQKVKTQLATAVTALQQAQVDGAQFRRRAGLSAPWNWEVINTQWDEVFSALSIHVTVELKLRA